MDETAPCPQPVLDLIEHLRSTGTGEGKLDALREHGQRCFDDQDAFLEGLHKIVPEGTVAKIMKFVGDQKASQIEESLPVDELGPTETEESRDHGADEVMRRTQGA